MEIFPVGSLPPGHKKLSRLLRRGWRTIAARREFTGDLRHVVHWNCDSRTTILQNAVVLALSPKKVGREDHVVEQRVHAIARQKWLLSNHCWLKIPSGQVSRWYKKPLTMWRVLCFGPDAAGKGETPLQGCPGLSRAIGTSKIHPWHRLAIIWYWSQIDTTWYFFAGNLPMRLSLLIKACHNELTDGWITIRWTSMGPYLMQTKLNPVRLRSLVYNMLNYYIIIHTDPDVCPSPE